MSAGGREGAEGQQILALSQGVGQGQSSTAAGTGSEMILFCSVGKELDGNDTWERISIGKMFQAAASFLQF